MKIACIQTNPQQDIVQNMLEITQQLQKCKAAGVALVVLPEMFSFMGDESQRYKSSSSLNEGIFADLKQIAQELNLHLIAGTHAEKIISTNKLSADNNKVYNTCVTYNNFGEIISVYRKIHLFNLKDLSGNKLYCESDIFAAGEQCSPFTLNIANECWQALSIVCYDLRFPEIIRNLQQKIDILFVPAAFTWQTGQDHWEILLRARAIENQCYVVACNQTGWHTQQQKRNYGHSMIIDPWGKIVASLHEEEALLIADINKDMLRESRMRIPALDNRQM